MLVAATAQAEPIVVKQEPISDDVWADMRGKSWHPNRGCPSRDRLVLMTVPFRNFSGQTALGQLIVAKSVAPAVSRIFSEIYQSAAFRIERMERVDEYGGDDDVSMAVNNTSAFNCRTVEGSTRLSAHAFGMAIDINPVQNPYVRGAEVAPQEGRAFDTLAKRKAAHERGQHGIILAGGPAVAAFKRNGWTWGGDWLTMKDYQHFSAHGR
jgi:poly-gamma-glutamate synthesis protein (capsule biosynthesis protein)